MAANSAFINARSHVAILLKFILGSFPRERANFQQLEPWPCAKMFPLYQETRVNRGSLNLKVSFVTWRGGAAFVFSVD